MKENFLKFQAQTTNNPISLEISNAEGSYVYDTNNKKYLDFVAGVSASNLGHKNKKIKEAILEQIEKYWHVMVYGEFVQEPTVKLCKLISDNLPNSLSSTYLTNSCNWLKELQAEVNLLLQKIVIMEVLKVQ